MNRFLANLLILSSLVLVGCARHEIDGTYGKRNPVAGRDSVNGTAVLADMFKESGFRVKGWRRLSPKLEEYDVIVWFPDDYAPPDKERRQFLENWLVNKSGRTLIYVGRDYDAVNSYWQSVRSTVPPDQAMEVSRRLATLTAQQSRARAALKTPEHCDWFTLKKAAAPGRVGQLSGPWSEGVNANHAEIYLNTQFAIPTEQEDDTWVHQFGVSGEAGKFQPLLTSEHGPLVTRIKVSEWGSSQLLVVANGSFLLNVPLANQDHRLLAVELIAACGTPGNAVFLESSAGGPAILDEDPENVYPTGLEIFTVWPLGVIALHLTALGILCCFAAYPIFGRPRHVVLNSNSSSERSATYRSGYYTGGSSTVDVAARRIERSHFGKHIDAVGELLELTQDRGYALERVKYYQEHVRRESGIGHQKKD